MNHPARFLAAILFLLPLSAPASAGSGQTAPDASLAGTWACQSVYGGPFTGRACHTWPQLMLRSDGTYTWGSEQGTWEVKEQQLHLSGRTGTGHLDADGKLIVEYEVKGTSYRQTLFRR
ncbi:MAG: hypothetical protein KGO52_06105 [Nitrospirota bacterium]|nr:hypothetical protein [Nitrospirota bacterium]MDE3118758.1 hypothetical protein [Nitrospirota bacterium]MDE3225780.1 hypothetical protein [Nitrospirota bacterium]MDE3242274.1 hypothetical protein [Nitrospirota bacterium]